jgi:hypothetical protein
MGLDIGEKMPHYNELSNDTTTETSISESIFVPGTMDNNLPEFTNDDDLPELERVDPIPDSRFVFFNVDRINIGNSGHYYVYFGVDMGGYREED